MKNNFLLFLIFSLTSLSAFSAEKRELRCTLKRNGIDVVKNQISKFQGLEDGLCDQMAYLEFKVEGISVDISAH